MVRQVDPMQESRLGTGMDVVKTAIFEAVFFAAVVTGRLLPLWMFINSLSLVCHT